MTEKSKNVVIQIETIGYAWFKWAPIAHFTGERAQDDGVRFGEKLIGTFPISDPMRPRVRIVDGKSGDELGAWFTE